MSCRTSTEKMDNSKEARKSSIDLVWDSGSSLYDSFELNSFKRQLDSAISSRSYSMPHLSDSNPRAPPHSAPPSTASSSKKSFNISRSLHKFMRSLFKPKTSKPSNPIIRMQGRAVVLQEEDEIERCSGLSAIPESPEMFSSGLGSLARRTVSNRFNRPTCVGVSCA